MGRRLPLLAPSIGAREYALGATSIFADDWSFQLRLNPPAGEVAHRSLIVFRHGERSHEFDAKDGDEAQPSVIIHPTDSTIFLHEDCMKIGEKTRLALPGGNLRICLRQRWVTPGPSRRPTSARKASVPEPAWLPAPARIRNASRAGYKSPSPLWGEVRRGAEPGTDQPSLTQHYAVASRQESVSFTRPGIHAG